MSTHLNNKLSNMSAGWERTVHKQGKRLEDGSDRSSVFDAQKALTIWKQELRDL